MAIQIIDNQHEATTVRQFLETSLPCTKRLDIATGYFEIGSLLLLDGTWQKLDKIRILFGDEVTARTKDVLDAMLEKLAAKIDDGMESDKEHDEFLTGVPAIIDALKSGKIECRVYSHSKFHAKAYLLYFNEATSDVLTTLHVSDTFALVGSSNFTKPGLTQNIELNTEFHDGDDVQKLREWFDRLWNDAQGINDVILNVAEKHAKEYTPFEVYARSMAEFYTEPEKSVSDWERSQSKIYPVLAQYQRDGYNNLVHIAGTYAGAFLCDGVGLGKTFIGLMLIERFLKKERRNVVLIVPASARDAVWEAAIQKYMPEVFEGFYPFKMLNHTDLILQSKQNLVRQIQEYGEVIIIDEAHHFRNRSSSSYRRLFEVMGGGAKKQLYMLTATPVNNSFLDLQHLIELFTQRNEEHFAMPPLGIHSLTGHFRKLEKALQESELCAGGDLNAQAIQNSALFSQDPLIAELVVQRSRSYVKKSLSSASILFPERRPPVVARYSLRKSYSALIDDFTKAFERTDKNGKRIVLLSLPVYSPYEDVYFKGDRSKLDDMATGRQQQIVNLMRLLLLKRFESSAEAFQETCIKLFVRLKKFVDEYKHLGNERSIDKFYLLNEDVFAYVHSYLESHGTSSSGLEDDMPDYVWEDESVCVNESDFDIPAMLSDTMDDMEVLVRFIDDIRRVAPEDDDKIRALTELLSTDERIKDKKVIIFTEYKATARYIETQLRQAGFTRIQEIDGETDGAKIGIIKTFAPYYNDVDPAGIAPEHEIKILIATDVLAEGLNLQDAQCLVNYELHWNPVRLMQRIGRVDRRRSFATESRLLSDHPELSADRANVYIWNFLPPEELNGLLSLYGTVTKKTLRISLAFGIEGKKLLTPDDDYAALKDFNAEYDGPESKTEEMALAWQKLLETYPGLLAQMERQPRRLFSGKVCKKARGIFFCYKLPAKNEAGEWTVEDGIRKWFFLDAQSGALEDDPYKIWRIIECPKTEPRTFSMNAEDFAAARRKVQSHIDRRYMRQMQVPAKYKMQLVTWLQVE